MYDFCVVQESVEGTSVLDVISQVTELEEKVYMELKVFFYMYVLIYNQFSFFLSLKFFFFCPQRANELANEMELLTFNIEEGFPSLMAYTQKLMGL